MPRPRRVVRRQRTHIVLTASEVNSLLAAVGGLLIEVSHTHPSFSPAAEWCCVLTGRLNPPELVEYMRARAEAARTAAMAAR